MDEEGITYKPDHYALQFLKNLSHLQTTDSFCDVTIRVADAEFRAHRNVLAAASPYFQVIHIVIRNIHGNLRQDSECRFLYEDSLKTN